MSDSHNPHDDMVPATFTDEPIANPGLPAHTWRPTDVDPKAEKRAERQVATLFGLSMVYARAGFTGRCFSVYPPSGERMITPVS